jgi:hypothetical protein
MIIGKSTTKDRMATTVVDFSRNIKFNGLAIQVPTKVSIIYVGGRYFCRCDEEPFTGIVTVYYGNHEYVKWKDKIYCVDTPEKFAILRNIIETEFAICQLK